MSLDHGYHTRRIVAGDEEEIPPGGRKLLVPFRGRAGIGVFNVQGKYYALRNICPHKQGPLCTGHVYGRIVADAPPSGRALDAPDYAVERDGEIIRCPWHLWEFDITTGRCLVDARARVKTYPVVVEDGRVIVYADSADLPRQETNLVALTGLLHPGGCGPLPQPRIERHAEAIAQEIEGQHAHEDCHAGEDRQ